MWCSLEPRHDPMMNMITQDDTPKDQDTNQLHKKLKKDEDPEACLALIEPTDMVKQTVVCKRTNNIWVGDSAASSHMTNGPTGVHDLKKSKEE